MTTGGGPGDEFVASFLDDYFAECEEHLTAVRRAILALESSPGSSTAESATLDELFRSFHTLKGLSAMVGVREAEQLAHHLESYLRALRDGALPLGPETISVLIDSTTLVERVIASRRAGHSAPPIGGALGTLEALGASRAASAAPEGTSAPGQALSGRPGAAWRFRFVPSAGLVSRGVTVDAIRARLASVGRITSVFPKVTPDGGIAFEFVVNGPERPEEFEGWREDGLTWERLPHAGERGLDPPAAADVPEATAPVAAESPMLAPSHFVRVDLTRLDEVMRRVADLVVTRARLEKNLARVERIVPAQEWRALQENGIAFERQLRDLREDVMRLRLVRVDEIFRRMPFVVRDLARETGKDVRVVLRGQGTEIDKFLVERMMDPVLHLVRNAVSHGVETPDRRAAAGKPALGVVTLSAATAGETVLLEVADDGGGIDAASVVARAREQDVRIPEGPLDARALVELICEPGLSTREDADRASGRGMGMAVVRTTIQELGGTLSAVTEPGRGTRFLVTLPLTLAITDALIAVASGHTFAVPQSSVQEVIEIDAATVRRLESHELVPYRGRSLPLLRLSQLLALRRETPPACHAFVIGTGQDAVALAVDRILGQREVVVRSMSDALLKIEGISGATELGDGRVVLILDAVALARKARAGRPAGAPEPLGAGPPGWRRAG